jgi:type I restriction-modification system DNA methylase subunit
MFHGFDFDATMLRLAAMNMMLHGDSYSGALATLRPSTS